MMFNRSLDAVDLPNLHSLTLGNSFNQSLEHVADRVINLQCLSFLGGFNAVFLPIGSMVLVYMLTWLGYIDGIHVTIYI